MEVLGIRFCSVTDQAEELAQFLGQDLELVPFYLPNLDAAGNFLGVVLPAGDSRIEVWPAAPETPACIMLQLIVDDADAWAERARLNGLNPQGPIDRGEERIYVLEAPGGLRMTLQSRVD